MSRNLNYCPNNATSKEPVCKVNPNLRIVNKRHYDPIKKHHFKVETLVEEPPQPVKKGDTWFPENKLSYRTVRDPQTGDYYNVNKTYDHDGKYSVSYDKLNYRPIKTPGTNFYRPYYYANSC